MDKGTKLYNGKVYNLSVWEDESYITKLGITHNCRCNVVATAENVTVQKEDELPVPNFKGNVGKDKEIFTQKHTFFKLANGNADAVRSMELSKLNAPYETAYTTKSGKKVQVNIHADQTDLAGNYEVAQSLANNANVNVSIRPHLNGRIIKRHKNPEYLINGKIADRKTPISKDYTKALSKANKQGCEIVVFDLSVNKDTIENALNAIKTILKFENVHTNIKEVYIVSADKTLHYKREKAN